MATVLMGVLPIQVCWTARINRGSCFVKKKVKQVGFVLGNQTNSKDHRVRDPY